MSEPLVPHELDPVLLGLNASREYEAKAEMYYRTRNLQLQNTKQAFAEFAAGLDEAAKQRVTELLKAGGLKAFTTHARQSTVLALLHEDLTPNVAQNAVNALDGTLSKVASLISWQEMGDYFNQHLDELQAQKVSEATSVNGLCLLILILTSIYAILVLIAVFACLFSSDRECANRILNDELAQACGS